MVQKGLKVCLNAHSGAYKSLNSRLNCFYISILRDFAEIIGK